MEVLHTCYRIGGIDRSVAFYSPLGFDERCFVRDPDGYGIELIERG